jgi:RNase P subunit RPR2
MDINIISINIIINVHHLFCKGTRPLVTVSTTVITILHSSEVIHFHCESCSPYAHVNYSQNTSKVSMQGNTMKSFKSSSNKLGSLDSLDKQM